jgi:uncharacterized protein (DUF608 family)
MNRPAKGYTPEHCFFALHIHNGPTRLLEGPIPDHLHLGPVGCPARQSGLPRFASVRFDAAYPLATVHFSDPSVPLKVRLDAFNPLTPPDVENSAWPVASLRWVLKNPTSKPIKASIAGSLMNFIGATGHDPRPAWGGYPDHSHHYKRNRNAYVEGDHVRGLRLYSEELPQLDEAWGTMALVTPIKRGLSHRTAWADLSWGDRLLDFWDDFTTDGKLDDREIGNQKSSVASLCVSVTVPARGELAVPFYIAWHFPNRYTWTPRQPSVPEDRIGNYYTTRFADAFEAADRFAGKAADLEARTCTFVDSVLSADVPEVVKEACLFNLSSLRSQTTFQTPDGHFFGWEGCHPNSGSCHGSCTHVWNYEAAVPMLFGSIARDQRRLEFAHATDDRGLMSFRINLPLSRARELGNAAADGQMGCIVKLYRDWRLSGDDALLRDLYPHAKRALEFCWIEGGWDADQDGLMEGCQHNTMDVEYYGPNPQMQAWYLAALLAAGEMATFTGDHAFADKCNRIFVTGSAATDAELFNGEYYEHKIMPPGDRPIAKGLTIGAGAKNLADPELQLGAGCLVDQLVGQCLAHQAGLGHVLDEANVSKALLSIHRYNFRKSLADHFNHLRNFALGNEPATLMATYPKGRRPRRPFPYFNEVMTGFEYAAAVGLIQEGHVDEGLELIAAVRSRHQGDRRNPFEEPECGHHYARAMAVWAALPALLQTDYDARNGELTLGRTGTAFFATGDAFGTAHVYARRATIRVKAGHLRLARVVLPGTTCRVDRELQGPAILEVRG